MLLRNTVIEIIIFILLLYTIIIDTSSIVVFMLCYHEIMFIVRIEFHVTRTAQFAYVFCSITELFRFLFNPFFSVFFSSLLSFYSFFSLFVFLLPA